MPIRTTKDAALGELGLVDFLQHDPRPTCIVDTAAGYIAYRNPALERLLAGAWNLQHFRDWAAALSPQSQPATYRGRAWNCILHNHKWLIASAQDELPVAPSPPVTHRAAAPVRSSSQNSINTRATSQHSNSNSNTNTGTSSSDSRRQSIASSSWRTVSDEGGQRYLDWTRIPSPAMTAHMHLIRNFPWQDTTIGSMHSWP
ncbi:hypothetical protein KCU82_g3667, partial [Aureobasidium melanogenum]